MAASAARVAGEYDDVAQIASDAVMCYGNDVANFWKGGKNKNFEIVDPMERVVGAARRASDAILRAGGKSEAAVAVEDAVKGGGKLLLSSSFKRASEVVQGSKEFSTSEGRDDTNVATAERVFVYNNEGGDDKEDREEDEDKENAREFSENGSQRPPVLTASSETVTDQQMFSALMTLNQAIEAERIHNLNTVRSKDSANHKQAWKHAILSGGKSVASRGSVTSNMSKKTIKWRDDDPSLTLSVCYEDEEDDEESVYTEDYRGGNTQMSLAGKEIHLIGKDQNHQHHEKEKPQSRMGTNLFPKFEIPDDFLQIQPSIIDNRVSGSRTEVSMAHNIPEDLIPTPFFSWNALFPNWDDTRGNDAPTRRDHRRKGGNASLGAKSSASSKVTSMAPLFNILADFPVEDTSVNRKPKSEGGVIHDLSDDDGENLASKGNQQLDHGQHEEPPKGRRKQLPSKGSKKQAQKSFESEGTSVTTSSRDTNDKSDNSNGKRSKKSEQLISRSPSNESTPILSNILPNTLFPAWDARTLMSMRSGNTTKNGDHRFAPLLNLFLPIPPPEQEEWQETNKDTKVVENAPESKERYVFPCDVKDENNPAKGAISKFGSPNRIIRRNLEDGVISVSSSQTGNSEKRILKSWTVSTAGTSNINYSECDTSADTDYGSGGDITRDDDATSATSAYRSKKSISSSKASCTNAEIIEGMEIFEKDRSANDTFDNEIKYEDGVNSEFEPKSMTTKSVISRHNKKCGNCCLGVFGGNDVKGEAIGDDASSHRSEDDESDRSRGSGYESGYFSNVEVDDLTILKQPRKGERKKKATWKRLLGKLNCSKMKKRANRNEDEYEDLPSCLHINQFRKTTRTAG